MIVVFGSNVLDLFFHQADLPPKDTALFLDTHVEAPGGKGANQAVAASRAGAEVRFFGALGQGGHGRQMYKNLASENIDVSGVVFKETPSGLATIFVDDTDGTHRVIVSQGSNLLAKQDTVPDKVLKDASIVLVQGELPMQETEDLLKRAKISGATTVMNFAPATQNLSDDLLHNLDFIILNEHEARAIATMKSLNDTDFPVLAKQLFDTYALSTIITLGPDGALGYDEKGAFSLNSLKIKALDTIGAGDAFTGFFCAALSKNLKLDEAYAHASVAGSLACTKVGAQSALPFEKDVSTFLDNVEIKRA